MKALFGAVLLISAIASCATSTFARTPPASAHRSAVSVFRLSVDGPVSRSDTFWVAYGPLAGTWGIIRLHAVGSNRFEAQATLPRGRTVFSFIAGRGVIHTRLGAEPGNPVSTIRQVGPAATGPAFPLVVWHEPIG